MSEQKKTTTSCCKAEYTHNESYKKPVAKKKCIRVPEIVGRNSSQVLIESVIPFPELFPAVEIKDIKKEVKSLLVHVCKNKVLINGVLHKNINYKTFEGGMKCGKLDTFYGDVRHVGVDIPFATYIDMPGAKPGDKYQIEFAGVEDDCEIDILEDPIPKCSVKAYKKLREKVIVKIDIKVLREVQIMVYPEQCNIICP